MICSSGIGFDPRVGDKRLTFGFEGIYQGTAVLYDHQTKSLWMHVTGECFEGAYEGTRLKRLDTGRHTTWEEWRRAHPETVVQRPDPRYRWRSDDKGYFTREGCRSGADYLPGVFAETIAVDDRRLGAHWLVHGVVVGEHARAYPFQHLRATAGVVEEKIGDLRATVWFDLASRSAAAFDTRLGKRTFSFVAAEKEHARFVDRETRSRWNMEGHCVAGPSRGLQLRPLHGLMAEWYGWVAHHPHTTVWKHTP